MSGAGTSSADVGRPTGVAEMVEEVEEEVEEDEEEDEGGLSKKLSSNFPPCCCPPCVCSDDSTCLRFTSTIELLKYARLACISSNS